MDKQEHAGAATLLEVGLRAILAARSSADLHTIRQVLIALEGDLHHRYREINDFDTTEIPTVKGQS